MPVAAPLAPPIEPPWVAKAQVQAGGRGKAGGIRMVSGTADLAQAAQEIGSLTIAGFPVRDIRVEAAILNARELYFGLVLDPARAEVIVMASQAGGIDVETEADRMATCNAALDASALHAALDAIAGAFPADLAPVVRAAGTILIEAFLDLDAAMIEINPLFVLPDGSWIAGDVRLDLDINALPRQPALAQLIADRAGTYADAAFKQAHGYDLVVTDPAGHIGLVATGAGLSMQLLDEMTRRGLSPYNFCDIRSGMMRGDPARLIENLTALKEAQNLRCVLVNIFAGITELGEFAALLLRARDAVPDLDVPFIVRLVGNGQDRAHEILLAAGHPGLTLERDMDRALDLCAEACDA